MSLVTSPAASAPRAASPPAPPSAPQPHQDPAVADKTSLRAAQEPVESLGVSPRARKLALAPVSCSLQLHEEV
jgi:hypothetical protein